MRLPLGLHAIYATLGYHLGHRREVQDHLNRQHQSSTQARREAERRFPTDQVRERIAQRRNLPDARFARFVGSPVLAS